MGGVPWWISPVGSLFGGDDESQMDGVKYPNWYEDPKFSDSQDFLNTYSKDLLNKGPNDYYKPIGEYNTPEFQAALNQGSQATVGATDAALARTGRARGGQGAQIAAQSLGDANASRVYQDYQRAMQGRQHFFDTGLNVQDSVRNAGYANQGAHNSFNVGGANFDFNKAVYGDQFDRQQSQDLGKTIGAIAPIAGAGLGFLVGGPAGASVGYGIGSSFGGGSGATPQWLDTITNSKKSGTNTESSNGVSSAFGSFDNQNSDDLMKILASVR